MGISPIEHTSRGPTTDLFSDFLRPYFLEAYRPVRTGDIFVVENNVGRVEFNVTACDPGEYGIVFQDTIIHIGLPITRREAEGPRKIGYVDIGGYQTELSRIREMIELPLAHPEMFTPLGVQPPRGILLHGPPGTGKSRLVRALAIETGAFHFLIDSPTEPGQLHAAFKEATANRPALVQIDNIDLLAPKRETSSGNASFLSGLLAEVDRLNREQEWQVLILGTTTRLEFVDMSLRRPECFDKEIEIGLPDCASRLDILRVHLRKTILAEDVNLEEIALQTEGSSGADLAALCREAAMEQIRHEIGRLDFKDNETDENGMRSPAVGMNDFLSILNAGRTR